MKIKWNKKYLTIAIYAIFVILVGILFFRLTEGLTTESVRLGSINMLLSPLIFALVIGYVVNILLRTFEKRLFGKPRFSTIPPKRKRALSLLLAYLVFILFVVFFMWMLLPRLVESVQGLATTLPATIQKTSQDIQTKLQDITIPEEVVHYLTQQWVTAVEWVNRFFTGGLPVIGNWLMGVFTNIVNAFLGFVLSIYFLLEKEKYGAIINKVLFATFPIERAERINHLVHKMDELMRQYIKGQVLIAFILASFFFVVMLIMRTPYPFLLAFILFVTDLIPIVGPWIGSIPVVLIIFLSNPTQGFIFIIVILIGQQLESNLLSPKVQGQQLGVSAFWILLTVIVANFFFGIPGMIVGLPVFVLIYTIVRDSVNSRLEKRGLATETEEYINMDKRHLPIRKSAVQIQQSEQKDQYEAFEEGDNSQK